MTRLLVLVVAAELVVGGLLALGRWRRSDPPVPELSFVDSLAAEQLEAQARKCRTAADWRALGEAYMAVGYFPEAEACHRVSVEMGPKDPILVYEWAFALERLGRTAEAAEQYGRAIDRGHPRAAACRYNIARCRLRDENPTDARTEFQLGETVPMARYELARLAYRDGNFVDALHELDPLLAEYPDAIQPNVLRHRIAHQQRDDRIAFQYADRADRATRRLPNPFDEDSRRLIAAHKAIGVRAKWTEAEGLLRREKYEQAGPILGEALAIEWNATAADLLAEVQLHRGDRMSAWAQLRSVVERDGPAADHLTRLGDICAEVTATPGLSADSARSALEAAHSAWSRAIVLGSLLESKNVHYKLSESLRATGDRAQGGLSHGSGANRRRDRTMRLGAMNDARGLFQEALRIDPKSAAAWFRLGELARVTGRPAEAARAYRECLTHDPDHGRAAAGLAMAEGK